MFTHQVSREKDIFSWALVKTLILVLQNCYLCDIFLFYTWHKKYLFFTNLWWMNIECSDVHRRFFVIIFKDFEIHLNRPFHNRCICSCEPKQLCHAMQNLNVKGSFEPCRCFSFCAAKLARAGQLAEENKLGCYCLLTPPLALRTHFLPLEPQAILFGKIQFKKIM
jgi:hypothetical protein